MLEGSRRLTSQTLRLTSVRLTFGLQLRRECDFLSQWLPQPGADRAALKHNFPSFQSRRESDSPNAFIRMANARR